MKKRKIQTLFLTAATLLTAGAAFGQVDLQYRAKQLPGWDARAREGHCEIRVWVDNRAEVRMRGDQIYVHTLEGSKSRDEGSECSQPLPYNSVANFQLRQVAGRSPVNLAQEPGRMNNYTATIAIVDTQNGGDNYAFEVSWRAEPAVATAPAPAPFFDDVRACQDMVRQRFSTQNGRGSYIDFETFADRQRLDQSPGGGRGQAQNRGRNRNQETIQGRGSARSRYESSNLTYSCVVDPGQAQVLSAAYQLSGNVQRANDRTRLK